jgi:hypothetical protein
MRQWRLWHIGAIAALSGGLWACGSSNGGMAPPPPGTVISSCQPITIPGPYALTATVNGTLNSQNQNCLTISASNVSLDCGHHTIDVTGTGIALTIALAQNVTIKNCSITATGTGTMFGLAVYGTQNLTLTNNTVTVNAPAGIGMVGDSSFNLTVSNSTFTVTNTNYYVMDLDGVQQAQITNNHLTTYGGAFYIQDSSSNVTISGNTIADTTGPADVTLADGSNNHVLGNHIDGGWKGDLATWSEQGTDDGILLANETGDSIAGNTVTNVFDASLETVGPLVGTWITGNTFTSAGEAAMSSYWGTSWVGNRVTGNQGSNTPYIGLFFWGGNSKPPWDTVTVVAFQDNVFDHNTLQSPSALPPVQDGRPNASMVVDFSTVNETGGALPLSLAADSNAISNNTLPSSKTGFWLYPGSAFIDGGGNICNPTNSGGVISCGSAPPTDAAIGAPLARLHPSALPPYPVRAHRAPRPRR